jgi:ABC-type phosphate transport system substrate-binding protein
MRQRYRLGILSVTAAAAVVLPVMAAAPALAGPARDVSARMAPGVGGYATINGSGSSYEYLALSQWINDVLPEGLTVNFNPDGTAEGQQDYMDGGLVDFAASDVAFRTVPDKLAGLGVQTVRWGYSYVPGVASAVSFLYHISVHGHLVRDLRLSGHTLMEIFTGQITNWDDPQITRDTGRQLPSLPITPVIRADDSGQTYFFSRWEAHQFPGQWNAFCRRVNPQITLPCGPTAFYPQFGRARAENGANNVADFITSTQGQGAIGYLETPYTVSSGFPVLALRNPAGKYVRPAPANVTTALTAASVNENPQSLYFMQENLNRVYVLRNPASYPLSYYSYLIVPRTGTKQPPIFTAAAGRSLRTFLSYTLCSGQSQLSGLDIASLPTNIVHAGLQEVRNIPGHGRVPAHCN